MNQLLSFLNGPSGKQSAMRVNTCVAVFTVMGVWAFVCIKTVSLVPMPLECSGIVLGALGLQIWHKDKEGKVNGTEKVGV